MGEIADMMLDGTMCQGCGVWLHGGEDGPGYPGYCGGCQPVNAQREPKFAKPKSGAKVACKVCGRHVKLTGIDDHMRDKHGPVGKTGSQ